MSTVLQKVQKIFQKWKVVKVVIKWPSKVLISIYVWVWVPCQPWIQFGPIWGISYVCWCILRVQCHRFLTSGSYEVRSINTFIRQKMCVFKFSSITKKNFRNYSIIDGTRALWRKGNSPLGLTQWGPPEVSYFASQLSKTMAST